MKTLFAAIITINLVVSSLVFAKPLNLAQSPWSFKLDKKRLLTVKKAMALPEKSWQSIKPGDYWQNLGFPNTTNSQRPIIGWYRCSFNIPKELQHEKLVLRIGAIDDLDQTYLNGQLIGKTDKNTFQYWAAQRLYQIPSGLLNKNSKNTLLIRVEDLHGKGGLTSQPFDIIAEKDIPKIVERINPLDFRTASLEFSIQYANVKDAQKATLIKMPLPFGKKWAFSTRWDDNSKKNFRMHDLMSKYGFKGAFYLYSNYRHSQKGMNYGAEEAKKLCGNGCVIGGHSITHPNMARIPKNDMFYEAAAIKVEREKDTDIPIVAFAFPGGAYRSKTDVSAWPDIGKALMRCGYHHNCYPVFVKPEKGISQKAVSTVQALSPGDRKAFPKAFDKRLKSILASKTLQKRNPNITWGVHVWLDEEGWANTEKIMKKYQGRKDWWYCSPNDYAAYRYLFHHSTLKKIATKGAVCHYRLTYPWCADLGADVPLTIKLENTIAKTCHANKGVAKLQTLSGLGQVIDIYQPTENNIPTRIDATDNATNKPFTQAAASTKFSGLKAWLSYNKQTETLTLTMKNDGSKALKKLFLKLWVPLRYQKKSEWIKLSELKPGQKLTKTIILQVNQPAEEYNIGKAYFVAQLDFLYNQTPSRYYATVRTNK